jgi:anti-sigma B factor antagonist
MTRSVQPEEGDEMALSDEAGDLDFAVTRETSGNATIVRVRGDVDVATSPQLRAELQTAIDAGTKEVVVDVSAMDFIDSAGLGVLIGALKRAREADVRLVLRGVQPSPRKVLGITGLDEMFTLEGDTSGE